MAHHRNAEIYPFRNQYVTVIYYSYQVYENRVESKGFASMDTSTFEQVNYSNRGED